MVTSCCRLSAAEIYSMKSNVMQAIKEHNLSESPREINRTCLIVTVTIFSEPKIGTHDLTNDFFSNLLIYLYEKSYKSIKIKSQYCE